MKKLLLAAYEVAGLVSASVPTKSKTLEYSKFELESDLNLEDLTSVVECRVYESSCGDGI